MTEPLCYAGHGFNQQLAKGRCSGQLQLSTTQLEFHYSDRGSNQNTNQGSDQVISVPLKGLQLSLGGANNRLLFFSHPTQPDWQFYTSDLNCLSAQPLQDNNILQAQVKAIKQQRQRHHGIGLLVLLILVTIPMVLFTNLDLFTKHIARQVPVEWEQKMGAAALEQFTASVKLLPEEDIDRYLLPLVEPLLKPYQNSTTRFKFHISDDSAVNAFALPGGFVVINSGLIKQATSASELQGVIAHEMAHVSQQHGIRNIISSAGLYLTVNALFGDLSGLLALLVDAAPLLIRQSYSRDFETEADQLGFAALVEAGIDPAGMVLFFETLQQEEEKQDPALGLNNIELLRTHPTTERRIANLERRLVQLPSQPWRDFEQPFASLRQITLNFMVDHEESVQ